VTAAIRFARFNAAGALGIGVQVAVLWALVRLLSMNYIVATAVGVCAAVAHNFVWHWRWTWADRRMPIVHVPGAFVRFAVTNGAVSLAGNVMLMWTLVTGAGLQPIAANLIAIAVCGLVNFWLADRLVFVSRRAVRQSD
jgi:putative flippase GtrA